MEQVTSGGIRRITPKWTSLVWSAGIIGVILTVSIIRLVVRNAHSLSNYQTFGLWIVAIIVPIAFYNLYRTIRRAREIFNDIKTTSIEELDINHIISSYCATLIAAYSAIALLVYLLR